MTRLVQYSVGVKDLAEFVHRRGDIHFRFATATSAEEGIYSQHQYQKLVQENSEKYVKELSLSGICELRSVKLKLSGRLDGFDIVNESTVLIEEIKTTRNDPAAVFNHSGSVHFAQAKLYAGLMAREKTFAKYRIRLTYLHPDTRKTTCYEGLYSRLEVLNFWLSSCSEYISWVSGIRNHQQKMMQGLRRLQFPFENYREDQRRVANYVYRSLRDKGNLLLDAPTGSGKTIATIFPALKAIGEGVINRVVYSTTRITGQRTILDALESISSLSNTEKIACITLTAKERICFNPELPCDPDLCEFANGYYDRVKPAIQDLMYGPIADQGQIERVARSHRVCPYRLGMDAAKWADLIVCDYNYVFDPLSQYEGLINRMFPKVALLLDEAHKLADRTADSLSAQLDQGVLTKGIEFSGHKIALVLNQINQLLEDFASKHLPTDGEIIVSRIPHSLLKAINSVRDDFVKVVDLSECPLVLECWSMLFRFISIHEIFREDDFVLLLRRQNGTLHLFIRCLKPAFHIKKSIDKYHGSVRFSGTLAPTELYQTLHGCSGPSVRSKPDFPADALGLFVVNDISTMYRHRKSTVARLASLLEKLPGLSGSKNKEHGSNYLVTFPSYEYLRLVLDSKETWGCPVSIQTPAMNESAREKFIAQMNNAKFCGLGFVVMGGAYTESIDYEGSGLAGVVVIGPSLSPSSLELDTLAEREWRGWDTAYLRPAMSRVVQCAGRVVRDSDQKGVVVLVDPRFSNRKYQSFFPCHWVPKATSSGNILRLISDFWPDSEKQTA